MYSHNDSGGNATVFVLNSHGKSLGKYPEYSKVIIDEHGLYKVIDRKIARQHRMNIGTITSDSMMRVKYLSGGNLGTIEETFVASLNIGDTFWFAGRNLELVQLKDTIAFVKRAKSTKSKVPSWQGGRMSLSSNMTTILRRTMQDAIDGNTGMIELESIAPILNVQKDWS